MLLLLGTAGCGGGGDSGGERSSAPPSSPASTQTQDFAADAPAPEEGRTAEPPSIAPTAAPGVAFNYRYDFRLPNARISAVQERHAAACEKLTLARCRITGFRYRLVEDDEIEALLAMKLDPAIAREFGKQGIDAVTQSEGMLVNAEITGEDVGSRIAAATRGQAELEEELKKVEDQLARSGLRSPERAELQIQAQHLRDQIRALRSSKRDDQESLATTPMVFNYGSGERLDGFDGRPRINQALEDALDNFVGGLLWIIVALITLLPWALLLALGLWVWRRLVQPRIARIGDAVAPPTPATAPPAEG
jgi:hypothetical protein